MLSRVVSPTTTTYLADYTPKHPQKERSRNWSISVTTGGSHIATPKSLYRTDFSDTAEQTTYRRVHKFQLDLLQLPPEYDSSVRPRLECQTGITDYQHGYGRLGERATTKRTVRKSRSLSKTTRANVAGTTRATHHPPKYDGHIPSEWSANRGKHTREDRSLEDITWEYHPMKTGYGGYVPSPDMVIDTSRRLKRTPTTYRDMCDELGYTIAE
jgi:hypothetical protein